MSSETPRVLVVDDDRAHRSMLREVLGDLSLTVTCAENGEEGLAAMEASTPDLVLLDMKMPVLDGMATLAAMKERGLRVPTVVLTAHAELSDAVQAIKLGAVDYLRKPIELASLQALVQQHVTLAPAGTGDRSLPAVPEGLVFESPLMQDVLQELARVARTDAPVLLRGETGTGKDVLAELLHRWSARHAGPLVAVNVAALPDSLIESELFGHVKGAYTGADATRDGRFHEADGGTLFLDEIGEMPLAMQPKLLRAVQTRCVARLGDSGDREVDFRLLTATNRDLEADTDCGRFRLDLYYRIAVVTIEVPPLRERKEDVPALARRFLAASGAGRKRLTPAAESCLLQHDWPGNIRELENAMTRAAILAPGEVVLPENLPPGLRAAAGSLDPVPVAADHTLAAMERTAILEALRHCDGNRTEAARRLGISRRKLVYRLKEYREQGLPPPA